MLGLAARITSGQMRVAEQPGCRVAEHLVGKLLPAVTPFANRKIAALAHQLADRSGR